MVAISRLKKDELHKLATEAGFEHEISDIGRDDLIEWLRENTDLVDESRVNRKPKHQQGNPTITSLGQKVEPAAVDGDEIKKLVAWVFDLVTQRLPDDDHNIEEFRDIAGLIIAACPSPELPTLNGILRYKTSGERARFFTIATRSTYAVMRNHDHGYGQAVVVAIVDLMQELAKDENRDRLPLIVEEVRRMKGLADDGAGRSQRPQETLEDDTGGATDEGSTGDAGGEHEGAD